jgi:hypothetical protein
VFLFQYSVFYEVVVLRMYALSRLLMHTHLQHSYNVNSELVWKEIYDFEVFFGGPGFFEFRQLSVSLK